MSFPCYLERRDSGVDWLGEVPAHWNVMPLKAVATHNVDVLDERTPPDTEIAYVDISSVDLVSGVHSIATMTFSEAPSRARRRVRHGDVIVSTVRTYLRAIARIHEPQDNLIVSTGFTVVRPSSRLVPEFLGYALSASYFVEQVIARSTGVSYPAINACDLVAIPITVPPTDEQSRIAAFLDRETAKIDALIAEQRKLIDLLKEKRQAVISHAVTKGLNPDVPMKPSGIEWLGDVPEHWEVLRVKHLTKSIEQGWSPQCEAVPAEAQGEWGVLKVGCVNGGKFSPSENKLLPLELSPIPSLSIARNDLLVSRANTRDLVGSAAVAEHDYPTLMLCDKLYRIRFDPDRTCPSFVASYIGSSAVREQIELDATGASPSMVNIAQAAIMDLVIAVPSRQEQNQIVESVSLELERFSTLITGAMSAIELLQERRVALISAAVTGQIDVRRLGEGVGA
jgi:type I restriction enzyme S subunit